MSSAAIAPARSVRDGGRLRYFVLATASLVLAGCAGGATPEPTSPARFDVEVKAVLARAESGGANEAQLAILRDARESGVLEFEPYKTSIDATFDCFRARGVDYRSGGTDESLGFPFIDYRVAGDESGPPPAATACEQENSAFVAELYQTQPASQEASEQRFVDAQPILIPCLAESGFLTVADPTPDEVRDAIWAGFDAAENGTAPAGFDPTACLTKAGITAGSF